MPTWSANGLLSRFAGLPINFCRMEGAGRKAGKNSAPPTESNVVGEHAPAAVERSPALRSTIYSCSAAQGGKRRQRGSAGGVSGGGAFAQPSPSPGSPLPPPHEKCRSFLQCALKGRTQQYSSLYTDRRHALELHRGTLGGTRFGGSQMCSFTILPHSPLSPLRLRRSKSMPPIPLLLYRVPLAFFPIKDRKIIDDKSTDGMGLSCVRRVSDVAL
jgi:hypothetical protein